MAVMEVLRRPAVEKLTGLSRSAIYSGIAEGRFPRPIKLGRKSVGWIANEIEAWQRQAAAERDARNSESGASAPEDGFRAT